MLDNERFKKLHDEVVRLVIYRLRKDYIGIPHAFYHDAAHTGTEDAFLERCPKEYPDGPHIVDEVYLFPKPTDDPKKFKNDLANRAEDLAVASLRTKEIRFLDRRSCRIKRGDIRRPGLPPPPPPDDTDEPPKETTKPPTKTDIRDWLERGLGEKEFARLTAYPAAYQRACQRIKTYLESKLKRPPPNITPEEIKVAEAIHEMLGKEPDQEIDFGLKIDPGPEKWRKARPNRATGMVARKEAPEFPPADSILNDPRLSADERDVLIEKFYEKLSWRDIAKRHGKYPSTVRRWHKKALAKLRKMPPEQR